MTIVKQLVAKVKNQMAAEEEMNRRKDNAIIMARKEPCNYGLSCEGREITEYCFSCLARDIMPRLVDRLRELQKQKRETRRGSGWGTT